MNFIQLINNRKGLTLIEIIVALAILMIVITSIYSLFSFGLLSFSLGNRQYDVQSDVRFAANYIETTVRYSTNVELLDLSSIDVNNLDDVDFIVLGSNGQFIYYKYDNVSSSHNAISFGQNIRDISFKSVNGNELEIIISGFDETNSQQYSLASQITLPNLHLENPSGSLRYPVMNNGDTGDVIKFSNEPITHFELNFTP